MFRTVFMTVKCLKWSYKEQNPYLMRLISHLEFPIEKPNKEKHNEKGKTLHIVCLTAGATNVNDYIFVTRFLICFLKIHSFLIIRIRKISFFSWYLESDLCSIIF